MIAASVVVTEEVASALPSRPDLALVCMRYAEDAMRAKAKERGRTVSSPPLMVDARPFAEGLVEITFRADTRPI